MPETTYTKDEIHVDHHAMWIDPANPKRILLGNDGGVKKKGARQRGQKSC